MTVALEKNLKDLVYDMFDDFKIEFCDYLAEYIYEMTIRIIRQKDCTCRCEHPQITDKSKIQQNITSSFKKFDHDELITKVEATKKEWFSISDICCLFNIKESSAYRYILNPEYMTKLGRRKIISRQNLFRFIDENIVKS